MPDIAAFHAATTLLILGAIAARGSTARFTRWAQAASAVVGLGVGRSSTTRRRRRILVCSHSPGGRGRVGAPLFERCFLLYLQRGMRMIRSFAIALTTGLVARGP